MRQLHFFLIPICSKGSLLFPLLIKNCLVHDKVIVLEHEWRPYRMCDSVQQKLGHTIALLMTITLKKTITSLTISRTEYFMKQTDIKRPTIYMIFVIQKNMKSNNKWRKENQKKVSCGYVWIWLWIKLWWKITNLYGT